MRYCIRLFIYALTLSLFASCKQPNGKANSESPNILELTKSDLSDFSFKMPLSDSLYQANVDIQVAEHIESVLNKLMPYLREKRAKVDGNIADIDFVYNANKGVFYVNKAYIYKVATSISPLVDEDLTASSNEELHNPPQKEEGEMRENISDLKGLESIIKRNCEASEEGVTNITLLYSYH